MSGIFTIEPLKLTIARRLSLAFGAVIAVFLGVGTITLYNVARLTEADRWNTHTHQVIDTANGMLLSMINMETGARGFQVAGEDQYLEPWTAGIQGFERSWDEAKRLTSDNPAQQQLLDEMQARHEEFLAVGRSMIQRRRAVEDGTVSMSDFIAEFRLGRDKTAMDRFRALQAGFDQAERDLLVVRSAAAAEQRSLNRLVTLCGSLLGVMVAIGLGLWVTRSILRQLGGEPDYASQVAGQIAQGNLAVEVQVRPGDTASLLAEMKSMRDSLAQVVRHVRQGSDGVAAASSQIAAGNATLSSRTERQAASLQETTASMEQLTQTVKQNSDTASQASRLVTGASEAAAKGGVVVGQVVDTMEGISASARKIADITSVIDAIAFQTNILALNAAVEAARAGADGRGFAVVAAEVGELAKRSANSAKEIEALISESVEKVEVGSRLTHAAGHSMQDISNQIGAVNELVADISSASREQSLGISQVETAVIELDNVTQENVAMVEQSVGAAHALTRQAVQLSEAVGVFKGA